jgi:hypothetical protein
MHHVFLIQRVRHPQCNDVLLLAAAAKQPQGTDKQQQPALGTQLSPGESIHVVMPCCVLFLCCFTFFTLFTATAYRADCFIQLPHYALWCRPRKQPAPQLQFF